MKQLFKQALIAAAMTGMVTLPAIAETRSVVNSDGVEIYYTSHGLNQWYVTQSPNGYSGVVNIPESIEVEGVNDSNTLQSFSELPEINGIYLVNSSDWDTPKVWVWNDAENFTGGTWPGEDMIRCGDFWKWENPSSEEPTNVIFNNGYGTQTSDLDYVRNGVYNWDGTLLGIAGNIEEIVQRVTGIEPNAFRDMVDLTRVGIPASVQYIGPAAFYGCENLESIVIPEGITHLNRETFRGCASLASVQFPSTLESMDYDIFWDCQSLTSVVVPEGFKRMSSSTFRECHALAEITLPSTLTEIGGETFQGCRSLKNVHLPEGLTSLPGSLFYGCSSLESVNIPAGIPEIPSYTCYDCTSLKSIILRRELQR